MQQQQQRLGQQRLGQQTWLSCTTRLFPAGLVRIVACSIGAFVWLLSFGFGCSVLLLGAPVKCFVN